MRVAGPDITEIRCSTGQSSDAEAKENNSFILSKPDATLQEMSSMTLAVALAGSVERWHHETLPSLLHGGTVFLSHIIQ